MFGLGALAIAIIASLVTGGMGAAWITHKVDLAEYNQLKADLHQAEADGLKQAAALREKYDVKREAEAAAWDQQRQALAQQARSANLKVERYVKERPGACITFGALRLLDGEILGVGAERLPLPAGQSDDGCAPLTSVTFYRSLLENLAACRQNSAQLDALIASVRRPAK